MKIRNIWLALLASLALASPSLAETKKPLTLKNGQLQQIQPGDTLDASQAVNVPLATGVTGTLPLANLPTGTSGAAIPVLNGANTWSSLQTLTQIYVGASGAPNYALSSVFQNTTTATDEATVRITRQTSHSGGTPGFVNNALNVTTITGSGVTDYEWSITGRIDNYATGGQNVGIYGQGNRMTTGTGPTWGAVAEVQEKVAITNPTSGLVGLEVDNRSNGTDSNNNRVGVDQVCVRYNTSGADTQCGYGFRVQNDGDGTHSIVKTAFATIANGYVGFDASGASLTQAAYKMAQGQPIAFDSSAVNQFAYNGAGLDYSISGTRMSRLAADGTVQSFANLASAYPATAQGAALGWNKTGGSGEADLFNLYTGATVAFARYQMTGTGAATQVDQISTDGMYTPAKGVTAKTLTYGVVSGVLPGCNGGGSVDDTTCLQNWINLAQGGILNLGTGLYKITSSLTSAGQITIIGTGGGGGLYSSSCTRGIRTASAAITALSLSATSKVSGICIDSSVTKTSGAGISIVGAINNSEISGNQVNGQFIGIEVSGAGGLQNIGTLIAQNVIIPANVSGAVAVRIGAFSTGASTVDTHITGNQLYCYQASGSPAVGMSIHDSGGAFISRNDPYGCNIGTRISPGGSQEADWNFFQSTALGDTSITNDLLIDTSASTAVVKGNSFSQTWASSGAGTNVLIQDSGASGNIKGNQFIGHRTYVTGSNVGFDVKVGTEFSLIGSHVCAAGSGGTGVLLEGSTANSNVTGNDIGSCDLVGAGSFATGVSVTTSNSNVGVISGNSFVGSTTPINYAPSAGNVSAAAIGSNLGTSNVVGTIASASTVTLTASGNFLLTGTTAVTTINGGWAGRSVTLTPTNAAGLSFNTGGNLCNAVTAAQNQVVSGFYDSATGCWRLR